MAPLDGPQPSAGPRMVTTVLLLACCRFWTLAAAGAVTVPACDVPVSLATLGGLSTAQQWNEQGPQIFPFQPGCVLHRHVPKTSLLRRRLSAGAAPAQGSLAVLTFVSDPAYLWRFAAFWATRVLYCSTQRYACIVGLYSEDRVGPLPNANYTAHFWKVKAVNDTLNLEYKWVFYQDTDAFILPSTAIPVHHMLDRPLVLQSEEDVSSAAFIMSDSAVTREFLRQWWDSAETGCCHVDRDKHDQTAYTHVLGQWLQRHTRRDLYTDAVTSELYKGLQPSTKAHFHSVPAPFLRWWRGDLVELSLQELPRMGGVQLISCMGIWPGCLSPDVPALLHHIGHWNRDKYAADVARVAQRYAQLVLQQRRAVNGSVVARAPWSTA